MRVHLKQECPAANYREEANLATGVNSSSHHCSVSDPEFLYIGRAKEKSLPGMGGGGKGGEIS